MYTENAQKKRPFWRYGKEGRKEDTIKTDFEKRRWDGVERIHMAYDREKLRALVNTVMDFDVQVTVHRDIFL